MGWAESVRRAITFFLLAVMAVSSVETALAGARTGPMDSVTTAHAHVAQDFSFHNPSSAPFDNDHGHHGSAGDHCTHAHTFTVTFSVFTLPISGTMPISFFPVDELKLGFVMPLSLRPPIR